MTVKNQTSTTQELSLEEKKARKSAYDKIWRDNNKQKKKANDEAYRERNKEKIRIQNKEYFEANKDKLLECSKKYYQDHLEERRFVSRVWRQANPDHHKQWRSNNNYFKKRYQLHKERLEIDPLYATKYKLRLAVCDAFKRIGKNKPTDTQTLLGCTWKEAKAHFEALFIEGMNWSNHGKWHIDHIRPVSSFGEDELHLMNHISNLQPLWAKDNIAKSDSLLFNI
jgi:hypothetical protein